MNELFSSYISIQSVNQKDKQTHTKKFYEKYKRIISNCELYAIDSSFIEAVSQSIKLLLLDTYIANIVNSRIYN